MATKSKSLTLLKSLDGQAVSFPIELALKRLDGSTVKVTITCEAHGKRAWSKIKQRHIDALLARAKAHQEQQDQADDDSPANVRRLEEAIEEAIVLESRLVQEFATGWSLSDDFTLENLQELEDRFGNALDQLIKAYDKAVYQGQLGN
jgi:hypothetical protein